MMMKNDRSTVRHVAIRSVLLIAAMVGAAYFYFRQDRFRLSFMGQEDAPPKTERQSLIFRTMSTIATIDLQNEDAATIQRALPRCRAAMESVNGLCNIFDPASELSRLNATAADKPFECSVELWNLLAQARRFHRLSGGAFDVTIDPLMRLWGFGGSPRTTIPTEQEIAEAKRRVGLEKVEFDEEKRTVRFTVPGMSINLGGIAKGYALDLTVAEAKRNGVSCGWIDLGGNVTALSEPPPGKKNYRAGLRDPFLRGQSFFGVIPILNESVSTSGDYERNTTIEGVRCGHIIDPRTGRPATGRISATVVAPTGVESDALSTTAFLAGPEIIPELQKEFPTLRAVIVQEKNGVLETLRFGSDLGGVPDAKRP